MIQNPSDEERLAVVRAQVRDLMDADGTVRVFDLATKRFKVLWAIDAVEQALMGRVSLDEHFTSENRMY